MQTNAANLNSMSGTLTPWDQPTAYERWYASSLGRAYATSLDRVLRPWLADTAEMLILDIGCGPGLAVERSFPPESHVIGMDCSLEMAKRAFFRSQQSGHPRAIVVGSAQKIPFGDASFDLAFSINCLEFVENQTVAFAEIARILRPSGRAVLGVLNRASVWEWSRRFWRLFKRQSYCQGRFFRQSELRELCERNGLAVEEISQAVHFPPLPPGPFLGLYERWDRWAQRHSLFGAGVILCRAVKT